MQQTTLNLIAIGVFGMTLSVLLGPILNISPTIPAVTTFGILSIATLDTLGFQGKGVTLLLDWLASSNREHRDRILHHEAGHFLIAYLLGIGITNYTLTAWEALKSGQNGLAGVSFDTQQLYRNQLAIAEIPLTLDRFCTVWMAGIAAETLIYGNAEGGAEDRQKLQEALTLFGYPVNNCAMKERWALLQAETMIKENWASYQALVVTMAQRSSVTDCYQVIQDHFNKKLSETVE